MTVRALCVQGIKPWGLGGRRYPSRRSNHGARNRAGRVRAFGHFLSLEETEPSMVPTNGPMRTHKWLYQPRTVSDGS